MKFTHFTFKNFKGIVDETLDLSSTSRVSALVGLNESGKTTILEAINYFAYKPENLEVLDLKSYEVNDIHDLIPISKRDNFNDAIEITGTLELDSDDIDSIKRALKREADITVTNCKSVVSFTQKYFFKSSIHDEEKDERTWSYPIKGIKGRAKAEKAVTHEDGLIANRVIKQRMPSILYFPNFLFEFPSRIYLNSTDKKQLFFQKILQDVLDSLNNDTTIAEHILARIDSEDRKDERNLQSLIGKMQKKMTEVIFSKWNQIFDKQISQKEVILYTGNDEIGSFIEFNIKDDVDTYTIGERSLGFRWFFVYILLTQFRSFRKDLNNALFLFDEPASNLHPSAQSALLQSFDKLPNVIYTTHSHYLINPKWLDSTFIVKNEAIDYDNEEEYNIKNTNIKIFKYRSFAVTHPNQISYFQPILEVLDYRPANLELVPKVIIVEGKNDFYLYNYLNEVMYNNSDHLNIVPGTSANNLEALISLYLGWSAAFVVLLDSDGTGFKQKERYIELYGPALQEHLVTYQDIDSRWNKFTSENIFEKQEINEIQKGSYPLEYNYKKKLFNRALQELYITKKRAVLSQQTKERFDKVIRFVGDKLK